MPEVDSTRPLLLGYIMKHLLMTDGELADARDQLEAFARVEGFTMGTIYVEETATCPVAFGALVEAVTRHEVTTIVVPSLLHLRALAVAHDVKATFERATGARVVAARWPRPGQRGNRSNEGDLDEVADDHSRGGN